MHNLLNNTSVEFELTHVSVSQHSELLMALYILPHHSSPVQSNISLFCPPLSIARYTFIQLSELEQCRVDEFPHGLMAAQDSKPGSLSRAPWLRGTASHSPLREPGFESCAAVLKPWASFLLYIAPVHSAI